MLLRVDIEKLTGILQDYHKITGLPIALLDSELNWIASCEMTRSQYCLMLQRADNAYRCKCSDKELLEKCRKSGKSQMHICHAGLCDMAMPIVFDGKVIAYILLGRIRRSCDIEDAVKNVPWFCGDREKLKTEFSRLVYYDESESESAANLAVAVAKYILTENMIRPHYNRIAAMVSDYIEENLASEITVKHICQKLGASKNLLYENIRSAFGCTVKELITEKRIARALVLLAETDAPVSEIADSVGVFNHPYFSRLITEKTGMSPLKYRKSKRTQ